MSIDTLRETIHTLGDYYNPVSYPGDSRHELRWVSAPVFRTAGEIAFSLTLWGPPSEIDRDQVDKFVNELSGAAAAATRRIRSSESTAGEQS